MSEDERAIRALIADGFDAISWSPDTPPDWGRFFGPYLDGAAMVPSARPAGFTDPASFRERMTGQREGGAMTRFEEAMLGCEVRVFGSIAVASASFEMSVNGGAPSRGVNMYLCVKDAGSWKIAAVAWDNESDAVPIPDALLG